MGHCRNCCRKSRPTFCSDVCERAYEWRRARRLTKKWFIDAQAKYNPETKKFTLNEIR